MIMQGPRVETCSFNPVHGSLIHGLMAFVDTSVCFFLFCFGPSHPSFQPTEMISGFDQRSVGIMGYVFPVFLSYRWFLLWGHLPEYMFRRSLIVKSLPSNNVVFHAIHHHRSLTNIVPTDRSRSRTDLCASPCLCWK